MLKLSSKINIQDTYAIRMSLKLQFPENCVYQFIIIVHFSVFIGSVFKDDFYFFSFRWLCVFVGDYKEMLLIGNSMTVSKQIIKKRFFSVL